MTTKTINFAGKTVNLETCAMHVAPGGSVKFVFTAKHAEILDFLRTLREEVAYGLYLAEDLGAEARLGIFFGLADLDTFNGLLDGQKAAAGWILERIDVPEGVQELAYTMQSRNAILA